MTSAGQELKTKVTFDLHNVLGKTMLLSNPVKPTKIESRSGPIDIRMKCQLLNHNDQCMKIRFASNVGFIDSDFNKEGKHFQL